MDDLVSIITVNYFSEDEIWECYSSIKKYNTANIELVLVSNSPLLEGFEKKVQSLDIPFKFHQNKNNTGFANACNQGAKLASGKFNFFLNPDTSFLNDTVSELLKCYYSNSHVGLIGPKTFNENLQPVTSVKLHLTKKDLWALILPFLKRKEPPIFDKTTPVEVINGHALFISSPLFSELDGMEERFFMYWEENDLCLRTKRKELNTLFCAEAKIIHKSGTSTSPYFIKMEIEKHRSQKKFISIHNPELIALNRIAGTMGYFWRSIGSLFLIDKRKTKQFWNLFLWYLFHYN